MKKLKRRPITLARESLVLLSKQELKAVAGGWGQSWAYQGQCSTLNVECPTTDYYC